MPKTGDSFSTVWDGLGLGATQLALNATITPATLAETRVGRSQPSEAQRYGLSLATLPLLSIELDLNAAAAMEADVGGDITVTGVLGEGGMGRVLIARQRSLGRDVAVKTVRDELLDASNVQNLISEGLITGYLEHPNITPVHQLGKDARGRPILVMKRITGVCWSELIAVPEHAAWTQLVTLPAERQKAHIEILMQVCNGLSFAHSRGVVHRDIKPDNVMIGEFGEVYLCDWGIALRLTDGESKGHGLVGTPSCLAPEMLDPELPITPATDVYLLGGALHTILTLKPRHCGRDLREVLEHAYLSEPIDYPAKVPAELASLCNRATARDPADRPASALEFRRELATFLTHESSSELTMVAHSRLAALEEVDPKSERAASIAAECRFAFEQAIRLWADNPAAQGGLQRCLELTLRVEIAREHLAAARALLAAMHHAAPEDEQAVEALAAALDARVRDASALAHERREADVSVASTIRRRLLFGMLFVGLVFGISTTFGKGTRPDDIVRPFSLAPIGLILVSGVTGFWFLRRKLFVNRANRRLAVILIGELVFSLAQRAVSVAVGETVAVVARTDMLLLTGTMFAAGVNLSRAWVVFSVVLLAAGGVMQVWPELTNAIFITSHMAALVVLALGWGNTAKG